MINFANDNILITKEFKNNSKQVLAYTLDKKQTILWMRMKYLMKEISGRYL